jgi:hypothetical protein
MNWKGAAKGAFKLSVTIGIFTLLFAEFGGGTVEVSRQGIVDGSIFYKPNPAMPGMFGKARAKLTGAALPDPYVSIGSEPPCQVADHDTLYAKTTSGEIARLKATRHCDEDTFDRVLSAADPAAVVPLAQASTDTVWLVKQGSQRVPMDVQDLWREIENVDLAVFVPWFLFATGIKLVGIFANIWRWQILLAAQGLGFEFSWLTASYFIGRFFGIVMPSTMGLDGWRLYDTIRITGKPVQCATVLAVERVIGLVGLLATILMFMPFADLSGRGVGDLLRAMALPLAAALVFGLLLLLKPEWVRPAANFAPARIRKFLQSALDAATAYSNRRGALALALGCAVFGQVTTMFMYFGTAMCVQVKGVTMFEVLYASAVMTLGTFLTPSAAGEGVRELVFVELLGGKATAAKAFLIGNLGFWIEKLVLSFEGGIFLMWAPKSYTYVKYEDMAKLKKKTEAERKALEDQDSAAK